MSEYVAIRGLYAITPDISDTAVLLDQSQQVLRGGGTLIQYRNKLADKTLATEQARALRRLTREASARLIVNDDVALAIAVGADGVHLGRDDFPKANFSEIRQQAGNPAFVVGVSCYNEMERARDAVMTGADYIAFGSLFPSSTKPGAIRADLAFLREARPKSLSLSSQLVALLLQTPTN